MQGGRAGLRTESRNAEELGLAREQAAASAGAGKGKLLFCVLCSTGMQTQTFGILLPNNHLLKNLKLAPGHIPAKVISTLLD